MHQSILKHQLRACRLVDTICTKESHREKEEYILTRQQFGSGKFSLDSPQNYVILEAQFRGDLNDYGSFCIAIPLQQITAIAGTLYESNLEWQRRAKLDPRAPRCLNMKKEPFVVRECVLLVLRPDLFLPENRPLSINASRLLGDSKGTLWTQYRLQDGSSYLINSSDEEFTKFDYVSERDQDQALSIFSLLVNANSKLQAAKKRGNYPPDTRVYITYIEEVIETIFFVPDGLEKIPPGLQKEASFPVPPVLSCLSDKTHVEFEDSNNYSEEDKEDDEPDRINGLTFSEMDSVLQKVSDGTISGQERAEAAMLMLGMSGDFGLHKFRSETSGDCNCHAWDDRRS